MMLLAGRLLFRRLLPLRVVCFSTEDAVMTAPKTMELLMKRMDRQVEEVRQKEKALNEQKTNLNKQQLRKDIARSAPLLTIHEEISSLGQNLRDLQEMIAQTKDKQQQQILKQEEGAVKQKLTELQEQCWGLLLPEAPYDNASEIMLEFRPGAGGSESSIFVEDISSMYESFCGMMGWRCSKVSAVKEVGTSRGYKSLDMRVVGEDALKIMRCEAGVHKVIRVPQTESKGRLHSSTISMVVMPVVPFNFELDLKEVKYQFAKSSGPGGQSVNKIESACRATHLPTGLQVFIQEDRSQDNNKKRATEILRQKLFEIEYKKAMEEEQSRRKSQVTTKDRSQKIRTYNYPQDRITDHRTGLTKYGIDKMMGAEFLEEFVEAYNEKLEKERMSALVEELYQEAGIPVRR